MVYIFFFKCLSCDYSVVLSEGNPGWIDTQGNFGRAMVDGTILGEPKGKTYKIWYDTELCVNCGDIYYTTGDYNLGIKIKQRQDINEPDGNVFIPNIYILINEEMCPKCGIKLLQGMEVLKKVINRDKCWKFDLYPMLAVQAAISCPKCKEDFLRYEQFWLGD